jgi:hypothetical protein
MGEETGNFNRKNAGQRDCNFTRRENLSNVATNEQKAVYSKPPRTRRGGAQMKKARNLLQAFSVFPRLRGATAPGAYFGSSAS